MLLLRRAFCAGAIFKIKENTMDYIAQANRISDELAEIRHSLHAHPEIGLSEFETAARIERELQACGIKTERILGTAVIGTLCGALPGRTAALRADIDALPIVEKTLCDFASAVPNVMHACGHDCHTAAVIGAAKLLAANSDKLHGTVKFFFQPDEEGCGGARRMVEYGCLNNPRVDAVFGMHVSPDLPLGTVGVRYGKFYAASNTFKVTVHGRSSHGAEPEKGIDALAAAVEMLTAIRSFRQEMREKHGPLVITVGQLHSGTAGNIIADTAEFEGIIRTLGPEARAETVSGFEKLVEAVSVSCGVKTDIVMRESYPGVVNDDEAAAFVEAQARKLFGDEKVTVIEQPTMTTEDFGYFLNERPGAFFHFGVGGEYPLHNPCFLPDDSMLPQAAALFAQIITSFLYDGDFSTEDR